VPSAPLRETLLLLQKLIHSFAAFPQRRPCACGAPLTMKMRAAPWSAAAKLPPFHGLDLSSRNAGDFWHCWIQLRLLPQPHSKAVAAATALQGAFGTVILMTAKRNSKVEP